MFLIKKKKKKKKKSFVIKNINTIVENDYVLVLFSSDMVYKPSWSWVIQTYKTMNRE